jgi:hypothetical protein
MYSFAYFFTHYIATDIKSGNLSILNSQYTVNIYQMTIRLLQK